MVACTNLFECWYVVPVEAVLQISAVVAIGWAEGLSHVNLRKVYIITWWWFGSLIPICLITAALMAQGMAKSRWCVHVCVEVGVCLLVCVCVLVCACQQVYSAAHNNRT